MKDYDVSRHEKEESILKGIIIVCTIAALGISAWALSLLIKGVDNASDTETQPSVTESYVEPDTNQNSQPGGNPPSMNQQPMG